MKGRRFLDFDMMFQRAADEGYRAQVVTPAGQASVEFALPFLDLEIENFLLRFGRTRQPVRRLATSQLEAARVFGGRLFKATFSGEILGCLRSSLDEAQRLDAGLRIRLHLIDVPELNELPWEFLLHPALDRFLALSAETPLVRYLDLPERIRPLAVEPPLKVLTVISSPADYSQLDVESEWRKLQESLGEFVDRGLLVLSRLESPTLTDLQRWLRRETCHILHFIGHGGFNLHTDDGVLLFTAENGRGREVAGYTLGTLLHDHRPLRLAVLNACEGARTSRSDPFAGVAQSLVRQGIPAVVAMQFEISDRAAIAFSHELYAALVDGYPIDAALAEARRALFIAGHELEWGTPVLYMRSPDGRIFELAATSTANQPAEPDPAAEPEPVEVEVDSASAEIESAPAEPGPVEVEIFTATLPVSPAQKPLAAEPTTLFPPAAEPEPVEVEPAADSAPAEIESAPAEPIPVEDEIFTATLPVSPAQEPLAAEPTTLLPPAAEPEPLKVEPAHLAPAEIEPAPAEPIPVEDEVFTAGPPVFRRMRSMLTGIGLTALLGLAVFMSRDILELIVRTPVERPSENPPPQTPAPAPSEPKEVPKTEGRAPIAETVVVRGVDVEPANLAVFPSGDLAVLDQKRGLFSLDPESSKIRRLLEGKEFDLYEPWDLVISPRERGREQILLTMTSRKSSSLAPKLARFDALGQPIGEWRLPYASSSLTGVAVDARRNLAYLADSRVSNIYTLSLDEPKATPIWFSGMRRAKTLGVMVLDARKGRLLIADPHQKVIHSLTLASKSHEIWLRDVGQPNALALDPVANRLFIADTLGKRILVVDLAEGTPKPRTFSAFKELSEPLGLALGPDGGVWIADRKAEAIFLVSKDGRLARTIKLG